MRFRAGLVIGFATGFYAGTMAGRERYEQINRMLTRVKRSDTFEEASDKAKAVVDLGVERAKDLVETTFSREPLAAEPVPAGPMARTPESGTAANGHESPDGGG
jgi:hypothetical protein